jgi:deoxyribose-phosphate aldolase
VMLQAVKDWKTATGQQRAVKPAGGIRTTKDAIKFLVAVNEVAGPAWLDPYYFRFGASSVLNDLIMQRRTQLDGHYSGPDYVPVD